MVSTTDGNDGTAVSTNVNREFLVRVMGIDVDAVDTSLTLLDVVTEAGVIYRRVYGPPDKAVRTEAVDRPKIMQAVTAADREDVGAPSVPYWQPEPGDARDRSRHRRGGTTLSGAVMRVKNLLAVASLLAVVVIPLFAACADDGDDNGQPAEIQTEKGLGVALVAANADLARSRSEEEDQGGSAVGPEAPVAPGEDQQGSAYGIDQAPVMQQTYNGITVSGYGTATVQADMAVVEFYFGAYGAVPGRPEEPTDPDTSTGGEGSTSVTTSAAAISEEDLQPVIDALIAVGIARDDIEFLGSSYYYDAYWSSATLRVSVRDFDLLGDAVGAATDASLTLGDISLQSTYVSYMVEDCGPLEEAALSAAVEDASARADAFASALGVTRGTLTGAQTYSYSPFGGSPCDVGNIGPYPVAEVAYSENRASDVALYANVTLTYAIQ